MTALLLLTALAAPCDFGSPGDPPRVHLITVAPGDDLFSSMGHTTLVFGGGELEDPLSFDWGAFDATRPDVLPAFLAGTLPYYLNAQPLESLRRITEHQDRLSVAQRIVADPADVRALYAAMAVESLPENRDYVYHWADANCSTRARDALDTLTGGAVRRALDHPVATTPRFEASRHLWRWPVLGFAWRFITSSRLDVPLTAWERAMVPEHLMSSLDSATVGGEPLVGGSCVLTDGTHRWAPAAPPPTWPWILPGLVGALALALTRKMRRHRVAGGLLVICGGVLGAIGIPSMALWAVSDLEGIGPTENWLLAGPQSLVFAVAGIQLARRARVSRSLVGATVFAGVLGVSVLLLDLRAAGPANGDIVAALLPPVIAAALSVWAWRDG